MLVLTRKSREVVVVGLSGAFEPLLTITVLEIVGGKVRLGFQADSTVPIHRGEVWQRILTSDQLDNPTPGPVPPARD